MTSQKTAINPTREQDFAQWYQEVISVADLAEHSAVRGCMIIKPWGYALWENIQKSLDKMIKETGHQNVYFPLLIPLSFLEKEAKHVEGFAKECAVVTHHRLESNGKGGLMPSPDAQLAEPMIIRPTSETIIGQAMSKWVQSYNDLPILINQWCNVMRWEMRTRLFLRTSEFLWQEGHTAHETQDEAVNETLMMLDVYEKLAQDYLAIPVIKGEKTPSERFPGAVDTYCIEAMMQDGKALQAGTSHFLGQNFSSAYDIKCMNRQQQMTHVFTTSWGSSTRLIGALIMTHSDDDGLVLPPRIAPEQIIIIPVVMKEEDRKLIEEYCQSLAQDLRKIACFDESIRVGIDKTARRAGEKFWGAVKKGIPVRIEVGKREIENDALSLSRRDKPAKEKTTQNRQTLLEKMSALLVEIQQQLFQRALDFQQAHTRRVTTLAELKAVFSGDENARNEFVLAHFDPSAENEAAILPLLKELKITTRCLPFGYQDEEGVCIFSGNKTCHQVILARAY